MIVMMLPLTIWDMVSQFMDQAISSKLSVFSDVAVVLAATICFFSTLKIGYDYINGHTQNNFWIILRPFVLLLVVCQFSMLVMKPFSGLVNILSREIAAGVDEVDEGYWKQMLDNSLSMYDAVGNGINDSFEQELKEIDDNPSAFALMILKVRCWAKKVFMHFLNVSSMTLGGSIAGLLMLIAKILLFVQQMIASIYLTLMAIVGPFVFALAILPSFEGGIRSWIARYIQISLWIPIGYLIMGLNLSLATSFANLAKTSGASFAQEWMMIACEIVTIVSISSVPKISQWFIESSGANDAHGSISQPARIALRKVTKT